MTLTQESDQIKSKANNRDESIEDVDKKPVPVRVKEARLKVLESHGVVQVNLQAAEAVEKGEVFYGGTK